MPSLGRLVASGAAECVNFPTRKSLAPKKTMSTIAAIDTTRVLTEESGPQNAP
jgi:hypothetical protein